MIKTLHNRDNHYHYKTFISYNFKKKPWSRQCLCTWFKNLSGSYCSGLFQMAGFRWSKWTRTPMVLPFAIGSPSMTVSRSSSLKKYFNKLLFLNIGFQSWLTWRTKKKEIETERTDRMTLSKEERKERE